MRLGIIEHHGPKWTAWLNLTRSHVTPPLCGPALARVQLLSHNAQSLPQFITGKARFIDAFVQKLTFDRSEWQF